MEPHGPAGVCGPHAGRTGLSGLAQGLLEALRAQIRARGNLRAGPNIWHKHKVIHHKAITRRTQRLHTGDIGVSVRAFDDYLREQPDSNATFTDLGHSEI